MTINPGDRVRLERKRYGLSYNIPPHLDQQIIEVTEVDRRPGGLIYGICNGDGIGVPLSAVAEVVHGTGKAASG